MTIGDNIKRLRKQARLTQRQLAEKIGTIQKVIADYETGRTKPPSDRLLALAQFFGVKVDELLGAKEVPLPKKANNQHDAAPHGNSRAVQLLKLFDRLSEEEQRTTLKQIRGLVAIKDSAD